jgi:hypothetical protein
MILAGPAQHAEHISTEPFKGDLTALTLWGPKDGRPREAGRFIPRCHVAVTKAIVYK